VKLLGGVATTKTEDTK